MPKPEINMHKINDYLCQHPDLSHAEFRVAYYTVHLDYGRRKNGLFWESAASIGERIGVDREWVRRTWGGIRQSSPLLARQAQHRGRDRGQIAGTTPRDRPRPSRGGVKAEGSQRMW